ncbi:MAG: mechanosensitive ion channel protein MscS [Robiginitomaculum sp.]|nr:MAG: mechanosensitive ion channel protein MscS [Robiginitomaculum sp.]
MEILREWYGLIANSPYAPFIRDIFAALGVFILGWIVARWADAVVRKRLSNNKGLQADDTYRPLIAIIVRYAIVLAALYAALDIAGIGAASLLAVFGAAGLALALAVQGTLSNVAAGLMLIFLRTIKVGEYIQTPDVEGTVLEIGLFTTEIKSPDGVFISVPNAQIWAKQVKNFSRFKTRRLDIILEISRDNDVGLALEVLQKTLSAHKLVTADSAQTVISGFTPTSVQLQARCWLKADNLRSDASQIRLSLHDALRAEGVKMPPLPLPAAK